MARQPTIEEMMGRTTRRIAVASLVCGMGFAVGGLAMSVDPVAMFALGAMSGLVLSIMFYAIAAWTFTHDQMIEHLGFAEKPKPPKPLTAEERAARDEKWRRDAMMMLRRERVMAGLPASNTDNLPWHTLPEDEKQETTR